MVLPETYNNIPVNYLYGSKLETIKRYALKRSRTADIRNISRFGDSQRAHYIGAAAEYATMEYFINNGIVPEVTPFKHDYIGLPTKFDFIIEGYTIDVKSGELRTFNIDTLGFGLNIREDQIKYLPDIVVYTPVIESQNVNGSVIMSRVVGWMPGEYIAKTYKVIREGVGYPCVRVPISDLFMMDSLIHEMCKPPIIPEILSSKLKSLPEGVTI